jgi:hypothetical protein
MPVLTVQSSPITGIPFTVDSATYTTPANITLGAGTYTVTMPQAYGNYRFVGWEDGTRDLARTINLQADTTITAYYKIPVTVHVGQIIRTIVTWTNMGEQTADFGVIVYFLKYIPELDKVVYYSYGTVVTRVSPKVTQTTTIDTPPVSEKGQTDSQVFSNLGCWDAMVAVTDPNFTQAYDTYFEPVAIEIVP